MVHAIPRTTQNTSSAVMQQRKEPRDRPTRDAMTMTPEQAAETILNAAGSGLRHYTPQNREAILAAAEMVIAAIRAEREA